MSTPSYGPQETADAIFFAAKTGDFNTNLKNNAPLDLQSIKTLAMATLDPDLEIEAVKGAVHKRFVKAFYHVASPLLPVEGMNIDFYNCADASIAQSMMRTYLARCDNDISKIFRTPKQPLGQVALESNIDVFWVRNAVHVRIWLITEEGTRAKPFSSMKLLTKILTSSHLLVVKDLSDTPLTKMLRMADAIDKHLVAGAVPPSLYRTPDTTVDTTHRVVPRGQTFTFQFLNVADTHVLKPSIIEDASIIRSAHKTNGSATGEFIFLAKKIGKTKLSLLLARPENLSVGWAEVEVEVVAP